MINHNDKLRIAVLYGGKSGEHEVSLLSAASVIKHLDRDRFDIVPVAIDKQGRWYVNKLDQVYLPSENRLLVKHQNSIAISCLGPLQQQGSLDNPHGHFDVIFPVVHGPYCEDGCLQGVLELADLPYVGSAVLGSALSMDKDISKRLLRAAGVATPEYQVVRAGDSPQQRAILYRTIYEQSGLPLFVKPARLGSSVGVHKVTAMDNLSACIEDAFRYDDKVVVEQAISGREIELAVLENSRFGEPPLVSVAGEITVDAEHGYYSYQAKYVDPAAAVLGVPASLSVEQTKLAQDVARLAFTTLECEGMARIDLFLQTESNRIVFNEANTIPGFTKISMYPRLWEASGISYCKLLTLLIELAIARHERKRRLVNDYQFNLK